MNEVTTPVEPKVINRAKYRLDDLLTWGDQTSPTFGFVTSIIKDANGFRYLIEGKPDPVDESEVLSLYREVKSRQKRVV